VTRPEITLGLIADDLTGGLDAGVKFAQAGLETVLVLQPGAGLEAPAQIVTTNSREGDGPTAVERVTEAVSWLSGRWFYKKIDSTMRGHVGLEVAAACEAIGLDKAVVCPAFIEEGRLVRDGQLWVGDQLLHRSPFAHDPFWPAATAEMAALLGQPATHLSLAMVGEGAEALAEAIRRAPTRLVTADAADNAHLDAIGRAALLADALPCGSLGLARPWVAALIGSRPAVPLPRPLGPGGPLLIVAGSRHPRTQEQVRQAVGRRGAARVRVSPAGAVREASVARSLAAGQDVVIQPPAEVIADPERRHALGLALGDQAACACAAPLGGLVIVGGETGAAVCQALGAVGIRILGELAVGIPVGQLVGGLAPGLTVVTKAGGFGQADALVEIMDHFRDEKGTKHER